MDITTPDHARRYCAVQPSLSYRRIAAEGVERAAMIDERYGNPTAAKRGREAAAILRGEKR